MAGKQFIFIAGILILAFAGFTIVKHWGYPIQVSALNSVGKTDSIQIFWNDYNLATQYRTQGKADSAIIAYQDALKLNPIHEDALYYLGNMYMKAGKLDKAQEVWKKLIELNPESERAFNQLGNLFFCVNHPNYFNPEKSKSYFKQAKELNKESLNPNLRLGEIELFQNNTNYAFISFSKLSMMDQKNVEIYFIKGYLNWKFGKEQDATRDLEHTFKLGRTAFSSQNKSLKKNQGCDLFNNWLIEFFQVPKKYFVKLEMPEMYKKFDQYLVSMRKQLNHD